MTIVLTAAHKGGEHTLSHDLNFQSERYEAKHQVVRLPPTVGCMLWSFHRWNARLLTATTDIPQPQA